MAGDPYGPADVHGPEARILEHLGRKGRLEIARLAASVHDSECRGASAVQLTSNDS